MKRNFEISRTVLYSHTLVFEQILDFERYEKYLPFCNSSRLLNKETKNFSHIGELEFEIAGIIYKIKSENFIENNKILIKQIVGPFEEMNATWDVKKLDDEKTKITFITDVKVSYFLGVLLRDSAIEKFVNIFLDSFVKDLAAKNKK